MLAMEYDPEEARQAWIEYGIEQGIKRGIVQGIGQGIEQGIEQLAKNLLKFNTPIEYIIKATGWSEDKIRSLANDEN